ncbi:dermokine isoform X3 [Cebus imitator]|uniref:dermokine isoform X3 n=1 Tax=Cebus imitator TaxID=2715852 RepID=UPI00189B2167|nr:dermokine isoform X3 [Cebus imitator]
MKFQGSLACLLLALCLGSGEAGPLQSGGEDTVANVGEAIGHGMGDALSQGVGQAIGKGAGEAASSGVSEALGQGTREAISTGVRQIPGSGAADALGNRVGEAAHALGNTGHEIGRQAEDIIRHGADAVRGSWQGVPGHNGAWETSGGHGIFGSQGGLGSQGQGNSGGLGTPWGQGYPGSSTGSFGTNPQGASWVQGGNGGPPNFGTNTQGAVAQPGYGSVRGGNPNSGCTNPPPSGSGGGSSNSGGGSSSESGGSGSGSNGGSNGGSSGNGSGSNSGGSSGNGSGSNSGGSSGNGSGSNSGGSRGGNGSGSNSGGSRGDSGSESSWGSSSGSSSGNHGGSGGGNGRTPGCENPENEARGTGGSGVQDYRGQGVSSNMREISKEDNRVLGGYRDNNQNSETSPGLFNFDTFWKNFKSKLGFINWDAINKNQVPPPSTRALLYFSRLWEDFKHKTPFLNWKAITEGVDATSLQKRSGSADQNNNYNQNAYPTAYGGQYSVKTPAKTISSNHYQGPEKHWSSGNSSPWPPACASPGSAAAHPPFPGWGPGLSLLFPTIARWCFSDCQPRRLHQPLSLLAPFCDLKAL